MQTTLLPGFHYILGVLSDRPTLSETIPYQLTGLMVVFTALGLIWVALTLSGLLFKRIAKAQAIAASAAPAPTPTPIVDELPPELVAVITAAVKVTLDGAYRIQAIVPVETDQGWMHEGRRQIFSSHKVR